jgi:Zn-dependent peptidase ImmA (M78 family)
MDQAERWTELLDLYPDSFKPVPEFTIPSNLPSQINTTDEIEAVADQMRGAWALGQNPIPDLIDTLESKGIMIISTGVETNKKFDGLAGHIAKTPVVVISSYRPGDRQRFTLAHELGHLVLKGRLSPDLDEEKACNQFAGAFLLPQKALVLHLGGHRHAIEPRELYLLKHEFGISMQAILVRAGQCGIISNHMRTQYFVMFSQQGWRSQEPGDPYPQEETILFTQLVYRALAENYIGESKAAELLGMSLTNFHKERKLGTPSSECDLSEGVLLGRLTHPD